MTESMRAHLYSCAMLPAEVLQGAQEIWASSQELVKHARELLDRADVLMREAEALTALRAAMKQSAFERLRRVIRIKLRDGSLPHDHIPATIPGRPGDNSACGGCDHLVTSPDLMMVVMRDAFRLSALHEATPIPFHTDCFELWNEERRLFKPVIPPPS